MPPAAGRRMRLEDFYFADPRLVLIPIEHLTPAGMSPEFAACLAARRGWTPEGIALFDAAFACYWRRSRDLAQRTRTWLPPRIRHVGLVTDPLAVRPYVQLLNTSTWQLYESDFAPGRSHPEFAAFLFVHGDRLAFSRNVSAAAIQAAAWWLERTDEECAAFARAARQATRPDAALFQGIADALPWLRQLHHERLRPPLVVSPQRPIPGTGLLVPPAHEAEVPRLVERSAHAANRALAAFHRAWRGGDPAHVARLCAWLAETRPPLLVTAPEERVIWDPQAPDRVGTLRAELRPADAVAVEAIAADLGTIARVTARFQALVVDLQALRRPPANLEHRGYSYLHRERSLIAYNLHEAGMERLHGPPLPYARAMLAARTAHEWGHLAAAAGWVPRRTPPSEWAARKAALAVQLHAVIDAAPRPLRVTTAADLEALGARPGEALTRILLRRIPDYQSNLVAERLLEAGELETYIRHNVRTLRGEYPPAALWRMLVRYLFEYQYLGFGAVGDRRAYLFHSTWFRDDFVTTGILDEARFDALAAAVAELCAAYAIDETRLRPP